MSKDGRLPEGVDEDRIDGGKAAFDYDKFHNDNLESLAEQFAEQEQAEIVNWIIDGSFKPEEFGEFCLKKFEEK